MKKRSLPPALRPYLFVLREGEEMKHNLLGYRLQLLDLRCGEVLSSPNQPLHCPQQVEKPDFPLEQLDFQRPSDGALFLDLDS